PCHSLPSYTSYNIPLPSTILFFCFTNTATSAISTLSLHDALPISDGDVGLRHHAYGIHHQRVAFPMPDGVAVKSGIRVIGMRARSEEHTSELQSHLNLVCRLLLEKKK